MGPKDAVHDPSRRAFFKKTAAAGATVLGASAATSLLAGCPTDETDGVYNAHEWDTMEAIADTVVPGQMWNGSQWVWSDPAHQPGAVQADVWTVIQDSFYGLNGWIEEAVDDVDDIANCKYSSWFSSTSFKEESLSRRESMIRGALNGDNGYYSEPLCSASFEYGQYTPIYRGCLAITKFAYFGAIRNTVGWSFIGFPGQSTGYSPSLNTSEPQYSCDGDCGGYGGACWCDSLCDGYNDCCADKVYECGL